MTTAIIDPECAAYRASYAATSIAEATGRMRRWIEDCASTVGADRVVLGLSDPTRTYWRHDVEWSYKAGKRDRPDLIVDVLEAVRAAYPTRMWPGLEADDVVGVLATCDSVKGDRVIVGDDKDLLTIPGRHYRPAKRQWVNITPVEAAGRHLMQALTGDSADNYPGCPGVGPKRASAIVSLMEPPERQWAMVVAAYVAAGLTQADAVVQARLARILRAEDFDLVSKTVRLWNPPGCSAAA